MCFKWQDIPYMKALAALLHKNLNSWAPWQPPSPHDATSRWEICLMSQWRPKESVAWSVDLRVRLCCFIMKPHLCLYWYSSITGNYSSRYRPKKFLYELRPSWVYTSRLGFRIKYIGKYNNEDYLQHPDNNNNFLKTNRSFIRVFTCTYSGHLATT